MATTTTTAFLRTHSPEKHHHMPGKNSNSHPHWYSPETGICSSKHPYVHLPADPFLDITTFIFTQKHNGTTALVDASTGKSISYSELQQLVKSVASGLHHHLGVRQGDVVLISLPNSIHFPIIFLAVQSLGAIVTTMNPLSSLLEIKKQALDSSVSLAFCLPGNAEKLSTLGFRVVAVPDKSVLFDDFVSAGNNYSTGSVFDKLLTSDANLAPRPRIKQEDTAAILYSSGTTGSVKGVVLTHRNFIASMELFVRFEASTYEYLSSENVYLAVLPMFHIYGLSMFVLGLLSLGTTVVVMRKFDVDEMARAIERYRVTHFPTVPPLLMALTRKAKASGVGTFRSLKQVSCGAAPVTAISIEEFTKTLPHVDFIQGYGMTESTAVGTRGYNTAKLRNYSSVGLLNPNVQAKVVDWVTGSFLPPGCMGELWLRCPGVMKEYLNNKEMTMSTIDNDGWLRTGDIVYFDQEGYLYVLDRLKEVIKYKGFQIAPADLEAVLMSHPEVLDAAVTAARDEEAGEIPVAFVVPKAGSLLSQEAVIDYVAKQVAPYKKVRRVYFRASIPRSAAGKILRRELRNILTSKL